MRLVILSNHLYMKADHVDWGIVKNYALEESFSIFRALGLYPPLPLLNKGKQKPQVW